MDFTTRKDATLSTNRNRRTPNPDEAENPGAAVPGQMPERAIREALLDLAYDASSYLRRSARPAIRVSAALLVAASLAACGPTGGLLPNTSAVVQPLNREVRLGLPSAPGRYPIVPGTLGRDAQGVYYFGWQRPGDPAAVRNNASVSLLRLA